MSDHIGPICHAGIITDSSWKHCQITLEHEQIITAASHLGAGPPGIRFESGKSPIL